MPDVQHDQPAPNSQSPICNGATISNFNYSPIPQTQTDKAASHPERLSDIDNQRQAQFISNLFNPQYPSAKAAAMAAGYSESYAEKVKGYLVTNNRLANLIRDYAKANDLLDLPLIYQLERTALKTAVCQSLSDPASAIENVGKLKHTIKQKKQISGILTADLEQGAPTIAIGEVRNLMIQIHGASRPDNQSSDGS